MRSGSLPSSRGRGIGLHSKIQAYALQDQGYDTLDANLALGLPADARTYGIAARMLREAGVRKVRMMTNNPLKVRGSRRTGSRSSFAYPT